MPLGRRFAVLVFALVALATGAQRITQAEDQPQPAESPKAEPAAARPATEPAPEKYKLTFKFRPNQIVHQEISHEFELTTSKNQEAETVRNSSKSKRHYRVAAVDDKTGVADLEMIIDWVHMVATFDKHDGSPVEPIEFQSDDPNKRPAKFAQIMASIGKSAWLRFNSTGRPVKGPAAKAKPGAADSTDGNLEAYLFLLPEQPVAIGETWNDPFATRVKDDEQNLVLIRLQRAYKLAKVVNGRATIECRTFIVTPINNPSVAAQFIERESTGRIEFDIEQGMIVSREWSVDKTIVNAVGSNSSMRAKGRYREKLLGLEATADRAGKIEAAKVNAGKTDAAKIDAGKVDAAKINAGKIQPTAASRDETP